MCDSRTPAALEQSGGGLIHHKSTEANYQQPLSDHAPENMDNPFLSCYRFAASGFRDYSLFNDFLNFPF